MIKEITFVCLLMMIISSIMRERVSKHLSFAKNMAMNVQTRFSKFRHINSGMALRGSYCQTSVKTISSHKTIETQSKSRKRETCEFSLPSRVYVRATAAYSLKPNRNLESEIIRMLYFLISDRCPEELLPLLSQATAQEVSHCERAAS